MKKSEIYISLLLLVVAVFILILSLYSARPKKSELASVTPTPALEPSLPPATPTPALILISSPDLSEPLVSPQKITGTIDKSFVFEGSFPFILSDTAGKILQKGTASAPNWLDSPGLTTPFELTLKFKAATGSGTLTIAKDNPSDLPENDQSIMLPVLFSP